MADQKISARSLIAYISGTEKIPVGTIANEAVTAKQIMMLSVPGAWSAATNLWPATREDGGPILRGCQFDNSANSTTLVDSNGDPVLAGAVIRALIDTPGQTAANWKVTYG